jgi:hypothetical protein
MPKELVIDETLEMGTFLIKRVLTDIITPLIERHDLKQDPSNPETPDVLKSSSTKHVMGTLSGVLDIYTELVKTYFLQES